jgi:hypothetical protein
VFRRTRRYLVPVRRKDLNDIFTSTYFVAREVRYISRKSTHAWSTVLLGRRKPSCTLRGASTRVPKAPLTPCIVLLHMNTVTFTMRIATFFVMTCSVSAFAPLSTKTSSRSSTLTQLEMVSNSKRKLALKVSKSDLL